MGGDNPPRLHFCFKKGREILPLFLFREEGRGVCLKVEIGINNRRSAPQKRTVPSLMSTPLHMVRASKPLLRVFSWFHASVTLPHPNWPRRRPHSQHSPAQINHTIRGKTEGQETRKSYLSVSLSSAVIRHAEKREGKKSVSQKSAH